MVSPALMGAALGAGSSLLSGITQRDANSRERRRFKRMVRGRRTSPEGQALSSAIERLRGLSERLPGQIRSNLRGQAVAQQQANLGKLNRSLAQRGYTSGSGVYGQAQRGAMGDLMNQQQRAEIGTGRLQSQLLGNLGNLSQRAGQYFNPMNMGPQEQFIDPTSIIGNAAMGGLLGSKLFGGGAPQAQGGTGTQVLSGGFNDVPFGYDTQQMSGGYRPPVTDIEQGFSF